MKALVVTNPFGDFAIGHHITDPEKIDEVLNGHHAGSVVQVSLPDAPPAREATSE